MLRHGTCGRCASASCSPTAGVASVGIRHIHVDQTTGAVTQAMDIRSFRSYQPPHRPMEVGEVARHERDTPFYNTGLWYRPATQWHAQGTSSLHCLHHSRQQSTRHRRAAVGYHSRLEWTQTHKLSNSAARLVVQSQHRS